MAESMESEKLSDTATSKDVVAEMMQNENYKLFFKSIIKEAVKEEQAEYRQSIIDLQTKVSDLQTQNEKLEGEIHELKCAEKKLSEKNKHLEKQTIQLQIELESRSDVLEDLQQYSRRNCLIVSGVPERGRHEKTDDLIKSVAAKAGVQVQDQDIDRSHRLGAPKPGRPRPIVVKFTRYNKRSELIKSRRKLKGTNIGVQEQLTPFNQWLLGKAQELVKRCDIATAAWSWDGVITVLVEKEGTSVTQKRRIKKVKDLNAIWQEGVRELERTTTPVSDKSYARVDYDSDSSESDSDSGDSEII